MPLLEEECALREKETRSALGLCTSASVTWHQLQWPIRQRWPLNTEAAQAHTLNFFCLFVFIFIFFLILNDDALSAPIN